MTPSFCSTPYLHCIFYSLLYPDMSTELLNRCLYIPATPIIHIFLCSFVDQFLTFRAPTSYMNRIYRSYTIVQRLVLLTEADKNNYWSLKYSGNQINCSYNFYVEVGSIMTPRQEVT
jgi:hypothetical protein